jgi:hypothetical protein
MAARTGLRTARASQAVWKQAVWKLVAYGRSGQAVSRTNDVTREGLMSDQMGGYNNPPAGYNPQGGYPHQQQQGGYTPPQGGYPQQQGGWGQPPGYGQQPGYGTPQSSGGMSLNLRSIMPGGLVAIVSGVLLFVVSFFKWWGADLGALCGDTPFGGDTCRALVGDVSFSAWRRGVTTFALILALVIAIAFVLKALQVLPARVPVELTAAGVLVVADICFLITFAAQPKGTSPGWAMWVGLLLAVGLNVGVIMALMSSGGLSTLKGGLTKVQTQQQSGYGQQQQQWGQPQQQWGQPPPQQQQWGQPQQPAGWPTGPSTGGQPAAPPQTGYTTGGQPAQPGWGQPEQPQQPPQQGWPQQQDPQQPGWGQQRPEEQPPQQGWPQQPPQQGGWPQ